MNSPIVTRSIASRSLISFLILSGFFLLTASLAPCQQTLADPVKSSNLIPNHKLAGLKEFRFNKELELKGWKVGQTMYLGQTKVGGKWGPGLVLDRGTYAYAINHRSISFSIRF